MKIALNKAYGGFSLTDDAYKMLIELGMKVITQDGDRDSADIIKFDDGHYMFIDDNNIKYRTDARLIKTIEVLGNAASKHHIEIINIPDINIEDLQINNHDGWETVEIPAQPQTY
jgi:hypothetical protein